MRSDVRGRTDAAKCLVFNHLPAHCVSPVPTLPPPLRLCECLIRLALVGSNLTSAQEPVLILKHSKATTPTAKHTKYISLEQNDPRARARLSSGNNSYRKEDQNFPEASPQRIGVKEIHIFNLIVWIDIRSLLGRLQDTFRHFKSGVVIQLLQRMKKRLARLRRSRATASLQRVNPDTLTLIPRLYTPSQMVNYSEIIPPLNQTAETLLGRLQP